MFNETFFDDVVVPDDCVVGPPDDGWRLARTTLGNERLSIGTGMHGAHESPMTIAASHGASGPEVERHAGALLAETITLGALAQRVVVRSLDGLEPAAEGAVLKLVSAQTGARRGEFALRCAGAGAAAAGPSDRLLAAPQSLIGGGTVEMQLNMIGERILGLPRG